MNKNYIRRLINFDDEGVDTSTGYVDNSLTEDMGTKGLYIKFFWYVGVEGPGEMGDGEIPDCSWCDDVFYDRKKDRYGDEWREYNFQKANRLLNTPINAIPDDVFDKVWWLDNNTKIDRDSERLLGSWLDETYGGDEVPDIGFEVKWWSGQSASHKFKFDLDLSGTKLTEFQQKLRKIAYDDSVWEDIADNAWEEFEEEHENLYSDDWDYFLDGETSTYYGDFADMLKKKKAELEQEMTPDDDDYYDYFEYEGKLSDDYIETLREEYMEEHEDELREKFDDEYYERYEGQIRKEVTKIKERFRKMLENYKEYGFKNPQK